MRVLHFAVLLAGLVSFASPLALAQAPDTLSPAQRAGLALARLGAGQKVRIHRSGLGRVQGELVSSSPSLVTLRTDGSVTDISVPSVDSVWMKHGSHAGTGALIGAIPAAVSLGALLATSGNPGPGGGSEQRDWTRFGLFVGSLFALVVGVTVGALIGRTQPRWQLQAP